MLLRSLSADSELATILEGIGEGFYSVDRDWRITRFNSEATRHFGIAAETVLGRVLWEVFPSANGSEIARMFQSVMANRTAATGETASVLVPGRWLGYRVFPLGDGIAVVFSDVTARKNAEAHRELLMNELDHRVRNTLAIVQSMAGQTLRNAGVDVAVRQALDSRLVALSNVHRVLTESNWESAELDDVVRSALGPHWAADSERFRIHGPALRLRPKSAVAVSMALHELCTNAIKYGALAVDAGRVEIGWQVTGSRFHLSWRESSGPPVVRPARTGFGSRLIQRGLAAELDGEVRLEYPPEGLRCTVDAPLAAVRDGGAA